MFFNSTVILTAGVFIHVTPFNKVPLTALAHTPPRVMVEGVCRAGVGGWSPADLSCSLSENVVSTHPWVLSFKCSHTLAPLASVLVARDRNTVRGTGGGENKSNLLAHLTVRFRDGSGFRTVKTRKVPLPPSHPLTPSLSLHPQPVSLSTSVSFSSTANELSPSVREGGMRGSWSQAVSSLYYH